MSIPKLPPHADVHNCFKFNCPKKWSSLDTTDDPSVRNCSTCHKPVFLVRTPEEFINHAQQSHCVAINPNEYAGVRSPDEDENDQVLLGDLMLPE